MRALIPSIGFCVFATLGFSNAGIFYGNGQTLELTSHKQVQMVSESITITPGRGPNLFDGGTDGTDRVDFRCLFILQNLSDDSVTIQVGFPLDAEDANMRPPAPRPTSEMIANYRFIAQDEQGIQNVTYAPGDRLKKLRHLFLWNMTFAPRERKNLRIDYTMPISMGVVEAVKNHRAAPYAKDWYAGLQTALEESFGYVTLTGASWAGVIERAEFTVKAGRFDDYIAHRPFTETNDLAKKERMLAQIPVERPTLFRHYSPEGWQTDETGDHNLIYTDYVPTENLRFRYHLFFFPRTVAELEKFLPLIKPGARLSTEDLTDLRDILREFNGEQTDNPRLADFLGNQVWHGKPVQNPVPAAVIEHLRELISRAPSDA